MKDDDLNFRSVVHRLLVQIQSPSRRSTLRRWAFQKPIMALASFRPSGVMVGRSLTAWFLASAFGPTPYSQCRANRRISRLDAMPLSRQSCRCGVVVGVAEWEILKYGSELAAPTPGTDTLYADISYDLVSTNDDLPVFSWIFQIRGWSVASEWYFRPLANESGTTTP